MYENKNIVMCGGRVPRAPSRSATEKHIALIQLRTQWRIQNFPEVEAPTLLEAPTSDFAQFSQSCMKLKEFGPRWGGGGASKIILCRSATGTYAGRQEVGG